MGTMASSNMDECDVCFVARPVFIPFIHCAHSSNFCQRCIQSWMKQGHQTCPLCRAQFRGNHQVEGIMYIFPAIPQTSSTTTSAMHTLMDCVSIGLLLGLILYPMIARN